MPEVLVLGTVAVRCDGRVRHPSAGLVRAVLAMLAAAGPAGVTADRLVETVWGEPVSTSALTVAVHRLRRWLCEAAGPGLRVERTSTGYALRPGTATDVARFRSLVDRAAALEPRERAATLGEALALWRGPALSDVPVERADEAVLAQLARERRDAGLARAGALLKAGDPAAAVESLEAEARRNPLDEPVHAALVTALAEAGRPAEAITTFQAIGARLRDECGVGPGPGLTGAIARARRAAAPAPRPVVPAQLPFDAAGFTGRARELAAVTTWSLAHRAIVVVGMGGVGKTALAVRWAHQAAARFPDGQLYADLRGYAAEAPMRPLDVLRGFLRALGLPPERVPADLEEAAAAYRSFLGSRRVLVVLDNAADADQVRPLLPGGSGCLVLVTGRGGLDGLAAVHGAARLDLDVLDEASAVALLRWSLGEARADREPDAVRGLARACGYLPIALRVAAQRLAVTGTRSVASYVARLRRNGLSEFVVDGDPSADVGAVFEHSYRRLPEPARRLFRLLGREPGPDVTAERTAVLAGLEPAAAQREIDLLVSAHLLASPEAGRYALHELIREHARSRPHVDATTVPG